MKQAGKGKLRRIAVLSTLLASGFTASYADSHDVYGVYLTQDRDSHISITDCGDGTPCGKVVWIDANALDPGDTPETLRTRDGRIVLGLEIFNGYRRHSRDWRGGRLYDPKTHRTYASRLKRLADGALQVKACIGPVCQTQIWPEIEGAEATDSASPIAIAEPAGPNTTD